MRSFLFVPADSERKLAKGPASGPDGLLCAHASTDAGVVTTSRRRGVAAAVPLPPLARLGRRASDGARHSTDSRPSDAASA